MHAAGSVEARGITPDEIEQAKAEGVRFTQRDGALVYLVETELGRYFFVVENVESGVVITVSDRRLPAREIERFKVRYEWRRQE